MHSAKGMEERILKELGLSHNQTKVYLTLLKHGSIRIGELAKKAGIYRANTYDAVQDLMKRGLVSYIICGKKRLYEAANPSKLLLNLSEQKTVLQEKEKIVSALIPELMALKDSALKKKQVQIFEGPEGLKAIFEDILRTGKTNHCIGAWGLPPVLTYYLKQWHYRRTKAKLLDKMLFKQGAERAKELAKLRYTQCRYLPKLYDSPTAINIYGNKVAFVIGLEPLGFVMENKQIADDFLDYFNLLWSMAKKV